MKLTKKQYLRTYYLNNRERLINYGKNYYKTHQQKCRLNNIRWKQNKKVQNSTKFIICSVFDGVS